MPALLTTLARTQSPPVYRVGPRILDACVNRNELPALPDFTVGCGDLSQDRIRAAHRVIEHSVLAIAHHLSTPPEAWEEEGRRTVRLWDLLEISVADDGTDFRIDHLSRDPETLHYQAQADLSRPISGFGWTAALDPVLVAGCRATGLAPGSLRGPMGDYIRRVLTRTFRRYVDWNALRRSVLRVLAPDPLLVSLTRRTFEGEFATIDSFNWVARHVRELSLVAVERPRLLPFLQLVEEEEGSPVQNFERLMAEAGMTASARRKLERWGFEAFSQAMEFGTLDSRAMIARYANILDRLQIDEGPSIMFTELALRGIRPEAPDWFLRALWNEVESLAVDNPDDPYPHDFELAVRWLADLPFDPDENQKQAGWPWIVEQAWKHRYATDVDGLYPWFVPCKAFKVGRYFVAPIDTVAGLYAEAQAMRNCLLTMYEDCRAGRLLVFSVRDDGQRVACFTLARMKTPAHFWVFVQVAGKANAPVAQEITDIAFQTAAMLNKPATQGR